MATEAISSREQIAQLTESANLQYGLRNYEAAAELYSRASEAQSELNGDMAPNNVDLLYLYGKCLYKVAVSNSDVLGSKVAGENKQKKKKNKGEHSKQASTLPTKDETIAGELVEAAVEAKDGVKAEPDTKPADKPYFQITGDENWDTDSDEDAEDEDGEAGAEEEDDDMMNAYEILDLARVIIKHKLEALAGHTIEEGETESKGKGKAVEYPGDISDPEVRETKEKLAEILDLQSDICLESERFADAVTDNRATLSLRSEWLPKESALIAESHYKLSLALEFASQSAPKEEAVANGDGSVKTPEVPEIDLEMRAEAAREMELAIESCILRIKKEEGDMGSFEGKAKERKQRDIQDVKEMLEDLEQRLVELRASPADLPKISGPAGATDTDPLGGLLGSILGESRADQQARIEEAAKGANVLTLKKKSAAPVTAASSSSKATSSHTNGNGKRKMEVTEANSGSKKTKVEEVPDVEG